LQDFKTRLINAEDSVRYPDKQQALEEYLNIGNLFIDTYNDYQCSAYFFKKTIKISKICNNKVYEVKAKLGLAKCYDHLK